MVPPAKTHLRSKTFYYIYAVLVNVSGSVIAPSILFANAFLIKDIGFILQNLQVSLPLLVSSLKQAAIYPKINKLHKANVYLEKLDQRVFQNMEEMEHIRQRVRQCHKMLFLVGFSYFLTLFVYSVQGFLTNQLPFGAWFPFNWRASALNYHCAFWTQVLGGIYQIIQNIGNDVYSVSYINIINGHIHCLCLRISRIGRKGSRSISENKAELAKCIEDHKNIMRYDIHQTFVI